MLEIVKQRDICIESCIVSNLLLGCVTDLRNHPVRYLLTKGIQASISSDGPTFFGYEGVTLDYLLAFVAWDISLRDLKRLCLNGILYSTVDDALKEYLLYEVFPKDWEAWVKNVIANYY